MVVLGFIILMAFVLSFYKLKVRNKLLLLGHGLTVDVGITVLVFAMHGGSYEGGVVAAVAGFFCAMFTIAASSMFGSIITVKVDPKTGNKLASTDQYEEYIPGWFRQYDPASICKGAKPSSTPRKAGIRLPRGN